MGQGFEREQASSKKGTRFCDSQQHHAGAAKVDYLSGFNSLSLPEFFLFTAVCRKASGRIVASSDSRGSGDDG